MHKSPLRLVCMQATYTLSFGKRCLGASYFPSEFAGKQSRIGYQYSSSRFVTWIRIGMAQYSTHCSAVEPQASFALGK